MSKKLKGYKAYNKGLICNGFQYELGKEYKHEGDFKLCNNGFHFCENPLDVLNYYPLVGSEFTEVEALGAIDKQKDGDSKIATNHIKIGAKIDLSAFIKASIDFIWEKASKKSIFKKSNATSGEYAHSATSGNRANSATSGYGAHSATSGDDAIACSVGRKAKAKATIGCWIVLAEWKEGELFTDAKPINIKAVKVDGKKILADTWYKLVAGELVITDDRNE